MSQVRQLAAIMFTDIAGYTALMQKDEKHALDILKVNLEIHQSIVERFGGQIIKELGDGILASFPTVTNCLSSAIEIQNGCNQTGKYKLSIGIHQGEVVFEKGDVFGDAVNVASRIQTLGVPGSILFSKKISEEINNKTGFKITSIGNFEFKNINEPVEVFALSNEGFPVPKRNAMAGKLKKRRQKFSYLLAGSSILLLLALLTYNNFFAASNTSDKRRNITANPIAYEWYAKAEYRITPENKNDLDSAIYFLQKAIEIDSSFALAHAELARAYAVKNYFVDPKGGYSEKAFVEAEKSLYLNPNLAEGYFARAYLRWNFQNKFPHEKAIQEYKKAIELDPSMDEAYHQLAVVYMHVGVMNESIEACRKAIQLNPDNKFAAVDLASIYNWTGKKEDMEQMIDLFKKTPDALMSPFRVSQWANTLISFGDYENASKILEGAMKKDSTNLFINSSLAILFGKKGEIKESLKTIKFCEKSNLNTGHFHHAVYNLAVAYAIIDEKEKATDKLKWVIENGFPNYTFFSNDKLLEPIHNYKPYQNLMSELKISNSKFLALANE